MPFVSGTRRVIAALAFLWLGACADDPYAPLQKRIERAEKLALICLRDVKHVPFEHSGNCIGASAFYWDFEARKSPDFTVCSEQNSSVCLRLGERSRYALRIIHLSIAESLFRFGKPQLILREERERTHKLRAHDFNFYRSIQDLRLAFAECLAAHPNPPKQPNDAAR